MLCPQASRVGSFHTTALLPHTSSSSSHTRGPLTRRTITPTAAAKDGAGDWYSSGNSSRGEMSSEDVRKRTRSRHYYDSTPKHRSSTGKTEASGSSPSVSDAVADAFTASFNIDVSSTRTRNNISSSTRGRSRGVSTAVAYDDDLGEEEDELQGRGWWEVPREQRGAGSGLQLDRWQEEQLLLAAASSKKKMQVQTVAANVGLDRSEVLAWVAAFRAKPKAEQAKLLAPLQQQIQQMKAEQQRQSEAAQAAEAARRAGSSSSRQQQQQQQQQDVAVPQQQARSQLQQGLPFSGKNPDTGFLPFSERRAQGDRSSSSSGSTKGKRLSGEVLRTLERVYGRSPWPNKDIVAGLYDLHRLPRDVVLDWFAARREMDGLPDNPRQAKQLAAAAAQQGLNTPPADSLLPAELLPAPRPAKQAAAAAFGGQEQLGLSGDLSLQQQQQQQERVRVQSLTAREMASIRSSLPSPRKQKGERLKQELGIKAGADATKQLEISGVTFVAKDGRAGWNRAWRKRRSASGLPAQQLDFNLWLCRSKEQQEQLDDQP